MTDMPHALKKFRGTLRICFRTIMARTFGKYIHSGWNGDFSYARYQWRGHDYFIQTEPANQPEPNVKCKGCGTLYHPSWNGPGELRICPDCSGAG